MTDHPHFCTALELREGARPVGPEAGVRAARNRVDRTVQLYGDGAGEWLEIEETRVLPVGGEVIEG